MYIFNDYKTRPSRPIGATCGSSNERVTDQLTDRHSQLQRCFVAPKNATRSASQTLKGGLGNPQYTAPGSLFDVFIPEQHPFPRWSASLFFSSYVHVQESAFTKSNENEDHQLSPSTLTFRIRTLFFLVACTRLYNPLRRSVRRSVRNTLLFCVVFGYFGSSGVILSHFFVVFGHFCLLLVIFGHF